MLLDASAEVRSAAAALFASLSKAVLDECERMNSVQAAQHPAQPPPAPQPTAVPAPTSPFDAFGDVPAPSAQPQPPAARPETSAYHLAFDLSQPSDAGTTQDLTAPPQHTNEAVVWNFDLQKSWGE